LWISMSETDDTAMLLTKILVPRRRDDVVSRPRLLDQLYDMVDHRLVLVTAPAGYGKTTLLVDFAADLEHPACWYSLDATDRDPRLFLERLILSLQRRFPGVGKEALRALEAGADLRGGAPGVVRMLVNEMVAQIPQWFLLVLDDYHALGVAPEIGAIVSNFVAYQRDQCMTIIASRSIPEIPLIISFVARGGVGGLGQIEVRFEPDEVQTLFAQNYATELSLPEARDLTAQFEGWITGLILTAHVRRQGVLQRWLKARSGAGAGEGLDSGDDDGLVYDYLAQEVFARQPPAMQRFLLRSSVLEQMSPTLCREILAMPGAESVLDALESGNMFVTRLAGEGEGETWMRYHHLFRDFLQTQFRREDAAGWAALHLEAARWFETAGQVQEAVAHFVTGGALREAARLMAAAAAGLYRRGQLTTLMAWRELVPEVVLEQVPRLALFQARAASKLGEAELALALTEVAERGYRASIPCVERPSETDPREGVIHALLERAEVLLSQGQAAAAIALGEAALALAEAEAPSLSYLGHRLLGLARVAEGDVAAGRVHLERALELSALGAPDYDRALVRTGLAYCLGLQGELEAAVALHLEAVEMWRSLGSEGGLVDELSDLAFHLYALGRYEEAVPYFQEALALCRRMGSRRAEAYVLVSLGELARDMGALELAAAYCERGRMLAHEAGIGFLEAYSREALGLVHRAGDRWAEAAAEIEAALAAAAGVDACAGADGNGADYPIGRYCASLGVVYAERGAHDQGLRLLEDAEVRLARAGLPVELYRAQLYRAWALFLSGEEPRAVAVLGQLLEAAPEHAQPLLFDAEAGRMSRLFEAASQAWQADASAQARVSRLALIRSRATEVAALGGILFAPGRETLAVRPGQGVQTGTALRIYGLGTGHVEVGGETVAAAAWGAVTARHLLFYLLMRGPRTREQIADALWPDLPAQKAKAAFHTAKFRLNRALRCESIAYDGVLYSFRDDLPVWFDVRALESALTAWRRTQDPPHVHHALALYRGDLLTGCYMDWCVEERESLRARCLAALEELAARLLSRRQYRRAAEALRQALELEPAREAFHAQLMRAYALCGERSQALAQYQRCAAALEEHLAAQPSKATVALYERILREAPLLNQET
jgi:LuxR family transcriptional regulator, maltose regulon positive regulatory protein